MQRQEEKLRRATEALGQAQAQLRQRLDLEQEQNRLAAELAQLEAELAGPAAAYDAGRHEVVRTRLAELDPLRREHEQLWRDGRAGRDAGERGSAGRATCLGCRGRNWPRSTNGWRGLAWDPEAFRAMEQALSEAEAALQTAPLAVARATAWVAGGEQQRSIALARQADRAAKAEAATRLGTRIGLLRGTGSRLYGPAHELNLQLRPDLAERSSQLLNDLTDGRYPDLELDESYLPTIVEDGEAKPVISGGEEDVVNLALRLAISQMIADRAGQPLSLLVLDEIFGSLDEERRGIGARLAARTVGSLPPGDADHPCRGNARCL